MHLNPVYKKWKGVIKKTAVFKMDSDDVEFCNAVLQDLLSRPCSKPFIDPMPTDDENFSDYIIRIKKPMYFNKIQGKILTGEYRSIKEWEKDVNLIFTNTERFFGKKDYMTYMANELRSHFDKLMSEGIPEKPKEWGLVIEDILQRVDSVIDSAPENISKHWKHEITIKPLPQMKTSEVRNLIKASQLLPGKEDAQSMFAIIKQMNPSINAFSEDVTLDLDTLSNKTHYALQWYIEKRLEEEGIEYPQVKK